MLRSIVKAGAAAAPVKAGTVVLIYHRVGTSSGLDVDLPADAGRGKVVAAGIDRGLQLAHEIVMLAVGWRSGDTY